MGQFAAQPPDGVPQRIELLDDHALVALVRSGDERGLGELYRRHAPTALRVARSLTRVGFDADDVVADVFDGIWQAIRNGKGPTTRFEPYLVAAIRNRAYSLPSQAIGQPIDDHDAALAMTDSEPEAGSNVARPAFALLPTREQQMLWLTAVEGRTVAEAATMLSLTRRAATTLKYRAKRAFAEAYLAAYGAAEVVEPVCRELCPKMSRYVRGTCPPRAKRTVEIHLSACPACRRLVRELTDVNATLRTVGPAAALAIAARGLSGGRRSAVAHRFGHSALRAATSKQAWLTVAAGVVVLLPSALLLGGDPPTPGPTIVDEALPAPTTTIRLIRAGTTTDGVVDLTRPAPTSSAPPSSLATHQVASLAPAIAATVPSVPAPTTTTVARPTIAAAPVAPVETAAESDMSVSVAVLPLVEAGLELSGGDEGVVIDVALSVPLVTIPPVETATESDMSVSVAVLPLVEAGLGLSGGDEGVVIDVALSVPLVTIPPVEITVPALELPVLNILQVPNITVPVIDIELPLPDLPLTDLPLLDLSLPG